MLRPRERLIRAIAAVALLCCVVSLVSFGLSFAICAAAAWLGGLLAATAWLPRRAAIIGVASLLPAFVFLLLALDQMKHTGHACAEPLIDLGSLPGHSGSRDRSSGPSVECIAALAREQPWFFSSGVLGAVGFATMALRLLWAWRPSDDQAPRARALSATDSESDA